jgi:protocatechuate 3,4-dioxygenase beta subunit
MRRGLLLLLVLIALSVQMLSERQRPSRVETEPVLLAPAVEQRGEPAVAPVSPSVVTGPAPARIEACGSEAVEEAAFLQVHVTDAAGRPAEGAMLELGVEDEDGDWVTLREAASAADGSPATFRRSLHAAELGGRELYLRVTAPSQMRPRFVAAHELQAGSLSVQLPPVGALELELTADPLPEVPAEFAWDGEVTVSCRYSDGFETEQRRSARIRGRRLRVDRVPAGIELELDGDDLPLPFGEGSWRGQGPDSHGAVRCAIWQLDWIHPEAADLPQPGFRMRIRGQVVDDLGLPIPAARVATWIEGAWVSEGSADADGRFVLEYEPNRGQVEAIRRDGIGIHAAAEGYAMETLRVPLERFAPTVDPRGGSVLVSSALQLRASGSNVFAGELLVDAWLRAEQVGVWCETQAPTLEAPSVERRGEGSRWFSVTWPRSASCSSAGADTGEAPGPAESCTLFVGLPHDPRPLCEVSDLRSPGAKSGWDPRLRPIDLRGRIRRVSFPVVDGVGRPVFDASLTVAARLDAGALATGAEVRTSLGRLSFLTGFPTVDVRVEAEGFEARDYRGLRGGETLVLLRKD